MSIVKNYIVRDEVDFWQISNGLVKRGFRLYEGRGWKYEEKVKYLNVWDDGDVTWSEKLDEGEVGFVFFDIDSYIKELEK